MRFRIFTTLMALCICLCACGGQTINSQATRLSAEDLKLCEDNAALLTEQIAMSVLSSENLKGSADTSPNETDLERFAISTLLFVDNEAYLYRDFYPVDEEGYIHLPCASIERQLFEVFGVNHRTIGTGFGANYDNEADEYTLMSGFGIGNGYECRDMQLQVDEENSEITVLYTLQTSSAFPDSEQIATCKSRFAVCIDNDTFYLRYLGTETE